MKPVKIIVKTKNEKYPILIGRSLIANFSNLLKKNSITYKKCLIVIDKNVPKNNLTKITKSFKNIEVHKYIFHANEKSKNQKSVDKILKILLDKNFSREDCVISIGGGITGDVVGFAASLFKRGLKFVNVPTTLLAQVDSSVGGKTGVNTKHGKNLIGSFYQPKIVISDVEFLKSLPFREIICGYGEILKHSIIANKKFYFYLDKNFHNILKLKSPFIENSIYESCKIKKLVVEKDEKEIGLRKILNFGHTFAHAYEASLNFSKSLNHGEAVILGIKSALKFSCEKKILKRDQFNLVFNHLDKQDFPHSIKDYFHLRDLNKIVSFMLRDKKNNSKKIKLMLIKKIGGPIVEKEFSHSTIKEFLQSGLSNKNL